METVYTIPLNEAFGIKDGCPFCMIREKLEKEAIEYTLGAAMMEPDVREKMNRLGFCRDHFSKLAASKNKLSLALILESHLDNVLARQETSTGTAANTTECTCFVCDRVNSTLERYTMNTGHMHYAAKAFRDQFLQQEFFCLPHSKMLLRQSQKALRRKQFESFRQDVLTVQRRYLNKLKADARKFADSYDYRNTGKEPGAEKKILDKAAKIM